MHPIRPHISHLLSERKTSLLEPLSPLSFYQWIREIDRRPRRRKETGTKLPEVFFLFEKEPDFFALLLDLLFQQVFPFLCFFFANQSGTPFQDISNPSTNQPFKKIFLRSIFAFFVKSKCFMLIFSCKPIRNSLKVYFNSKIKTTLFILLLFVEKNKCSVIQGLNKDKNVSNPIFRHRQHFFKINPCIYFASFFRKQVF